MSRRAVVTVCVVAVVAVAGFFAWSSTRPEPAPTPPADRRYEDVDRAEYEAWMQDLGYTE